MTAKKYLNPSKYTKDQLGDILVDILVDLESSQSHFEAVKAQYDFMDNSETKKAMIAKLMPLEGKSVSEREAEARRTEDFKNHMRGLKDLGRQYANAKAEYESKKRLYETLNHVFLKKS